MCAAWRVVLDAVYLRLSKSSLSSQPDPGERVAAPGDIRRFRFQRCRSGAGAGNSGQRCLGGVWQRYGPGIGILRLSTLALLLFALPAVVSCGLTDATGPGADGTEGAAGDSGDASGGSDAPSTGDSSDGVAGGETDGAATGDDGALVARAGDDVMVQTGADMVLNGSAGSATVELEKADTPVARFWAPLLESETTLEFTLTVSNDRADASDSVLVTISTGTVPTAAAAELLIIASPAVGPSPLTVELTAARFDGTPVPEALYVWDFGDTATAEGPAVTHTFVRLGAHTVTLRAIDPDGAAGVIWTATTVVEAYDPSDPPPPDIPGGAGDDEPDGMDGTGGSGGLGDPEENQPPVAVASVNTWPTFPGAVVILDGSGSFDPDDGPEPITYLWTQTGGTPVTDDPLFEPWAVHPRFTAPGATGDPSLDTLAFELVVFDGKESSVVDQVEVTVAPCNFGQDTDGDGTNDCADGCPGDPAKTAPGVCGCGLPDLDVDGDGLIDCDKVAFDDHYYVFSDRQKYIGLRILVDETVPGQLPALLDMSTLTFTIDTQPTHGQLLPAEPHTTMAASLPSLRYVPDAGFAGQDSFTFTVTDSAGHASNEATVRLTVGLWEAPLGLPEPSFGVREAHTMYASATYNFQPRQVQQIQASGDDAAWSVVGGGWNSATVKLPLIGNPGAEEQGFMRFPIRIPNGATIRRATIRFVVFAGIVGVSDQPAAVHLLDAVDMPDLTTNQSAWATLGQPVAWPIDLAWDFQSSDEVYSADISALVQTYIDQPGRQVGDAMGLKITRDYSAVPPAVWTLLQMRSWDYGDGSDAPILTVIYEPAGHDPAQPYRVATDGPYTHYVDFDAPQAEDIDANGFFNFGTPGNPRRTIPTFLEPGTVVEVHGTTQVSDESLRITGRVIGGQIGGTPADPIFVRGAGGSPKPLIRRPLEIRCNYIVFENLHSATTGTGSTPSNINLRNTHRVDHVRAVDVGPIAFHHVAVRHSTIRPISGEVKKSLVTLRTYRDDADTAVHDIVLYDNHLLDNGDWTRLVGTEDNGGIAIRGNSHDVWLLGNHIHHVAGDAIGMPSESLFAGGLQRPATRVYIRRNHLHHCRENHIDGKLSQQVFISQNKLHTLMDLGPGGTSNAQSLFFTHGGGQSDYVRAADEIWVMFNEIYDTGTGFVHTSNGPVPPSNPDVEARSYLIGNVLHHVWVGPTQTGTAVSFGLSVTCRVVNNTVFRCARGLRIGSPGQAGPGGTAVTVRVRNNIMADLKTTQPHVDYREGTMVDGLERNVYDLDPVLSPTLLVKVYPEGYRSVAELQAAGYGAGSIVGEVLFVGARAADFRPQPGSPVIGAGDADYVYQLYFTRYGRNLRFDYNGVARPGDDVWDIGALQAGN